MKILENFLFFPRFGRVVGGVSILENKEWTWRLCPILKNKMNNFKPENRLRRIAVFLQIERKNKYE